MRMCVKYEERFLIQLSFALDHIIAFNWMLPLIIFFFLINKFWPKGRGRGDLNKRPLHEA